VDAGYRTLPFPWPELTPPELAIQETWELERFVGYLRTWSAVGAYVKAAGTDPVALVERAAEWNARPSAVSVTGLASRSKSFAFRRPEWAEELAVQPVDSRAPGSRA
jgi:hypothetical protein